MKRVCSKQGWTRIFEMRAFVLAMPHPKLYPFSSGGGLGVFFNNGEICLCQVELQLLCIVCTLLNYWSVLLASYILGTCIVSQSNILSPRKRMSAPGTPWKLGIRWAWKGEMPCQMLLTKILTRYLPKSLSDWGSFFIYQLELSTGPCIPWCTCDVTKSYCSLSCRECNGQAKANATQYQRLHCSSKCKSLRKRSCFWFEDNLRSMLYLQDKLSQSIYFFGWSESAELTGRRGRCDVHVCSGKSLFL